MKRLVYLMVLVCLQQFVSGQEKIIRGKITDDTGVPIQGTTIQVLSSGKMTISDAGGRFEIKTVSGGILRFSMIGMKQQEFRVGTSTELNIQMSSDEVSLDNVIITAYGRKQEKIKLGYSAQSVKGEDLENTAEANIVNALIGKLAGVNITPSGGGAGGGSNIVIRGYSSISGNNQPLFVIDGVPISNQTDPSNSGGDAADYRDAYNIYRGTNRAIDINQFDIESISVLKGGSATAMYGSRANNGVILIKTKTGKKGFDISLHSGLEISEISKSPGIQHKYTQGSGGIFSYTNTQKFGPAYADKPLFPAGTVIDLNMDGTLEDVSGQPIPNYAGYYQDFWRTGLTSKNILSLSGGNEKGDLFASFSNDDIHSIMPEDAYKKSSFFIKGNYHLTDKLTLNVSSNYIGSDMIVFPAGYRSPTYALSTIFNSVYDIKGPWKDAQGNTTFYSKSNNKTTPVWIVKEEQEADNLNRVIGFAGLEYKISNGLELNYKLGVDNYNEKRKRLRPIGSPFVSDGDIYDIYINSRNINSDLILSGNKNMAGGMIKINYLLGNNIFEEHYDRSFIWWQGRGHIFLNINFIFLGVIKTN